MTPDPTIQTPEETAFWAKAERDLAMTNPHIIVGEPRRCLCGMYGITEMAGQRPTSCGDILAALERLVQTKDGDAILLCEVITPLVKDCTP